MEISVALHFLLFAYGLFTFLLINGWYKIKSQSLEKVSSDNSYSIVIPFRDEADRLPMLLSDLNDKDFNKDLKEIIFINDHSQDNSDQVLVDLKSNLPIKILHLNDGEHGKKKA